MPDSFGFGAPDSSITFRTALASAHEEGTPTLSAVARRLTPSTRTLQHRLDTRLLHDTDLNVDSIAARSGYADARALLRAVHRWYGTTPAALRRTGLPDREPTGLLDAR
ncbi:helix-turn-helix domain-containing protein [Streptomyces sp. 4.24]|uniref:helix-turn-helix domain-containing protein n=1 Tax=Streptomyces tritrimontium TaxID=3406573 RepID=UPI003BB573BD